MKKRQIAIKKSECKSYARVRPVLSLNCLFIFQTNKLVFNLLIFFFSLFIITPIAAALSANLTIPIVCGNKQCDIGENSDNCPEDCSAFSFEYYIDSPTNQITYPSDERNITVILINRINETIKVNAAIIGDISEIMNLSLNTIELEVNKKDRLEIMLLVPDNAKPETKTGFIELTSGSASSKIFFQVKIKTMREQPIEIDIGLINDIISAEENISFEYGVFFNNMTAIDITLNASVYAIPANNLVFSAPVNFIFTQGVNRHIGAISPAEAGISLPEGSYRLVLSTEEELGFATNSAAIFTIIRPFWTPIKIIFIVSIFLIIALSVGGFYSYRAYSKYKRSKMRYIMPDFSKLPESGENAYWIGYIAELNKKAYFNPNDLTTHALVAGSTGSGKSVAASVIVEEALLKNVSVVVFDPTSQWTGFVKQCTDKNLLANYRKFNMHEDEARSFRGLIYNVTSPKVKIDIMAYLNPGEITVFNLSQLKPGQYDLAVQAIVDTIFGMKWNESPELKYLFVFDEVHRLLEKYGGSGGYIALEKAAREFRKWGIGIIMVSQVSSDFKEVVAGNILTEVQLNTKSIDDIQKIAEKHGIEYSSKVTRQGIGVGMVQNPKHNNGKPWFVQFRPTYHNPHSLTDAEIKMYTEYSDRISIIEFMLKNAKDNTIDVDDVYLDIKLVKNKLKEGKFKMVNMSLQTISDKLAMKVSPKTERLFK